MTNADDIVGHKTFSDGHGGFRHGPLRRAEADALWEAAQKAELARAEKYPDEQTCVNAIWDACQRLEKLGWKPARMAAPDGKLRKVISLGSAGIHEAYCEQRPQRMTTANWWWAPHEGDLWPYEAIYFKP